jgi:hypothetical protein
MSESVSRCEHALLQTVNLMHLSLRDVIALAPPCVATEEEAATVDRAAIELERQRSQEKERVSRLVQQLDRQFRALEHTIGECLYDVPVDVMDADLDALNSENLMLADQIIAAYDEAAVLTTRIESCVKCSRIPGA